jgi:precorrin-6A synthase
MRKIFIIGVGAGNPEHITIQAINALNRADVFFIPNKGAEKQDLQQLRRDICERYIKDRDYRLVDFKTPERGQDPVDYKAAVHDWHARIEENYQKLFMEELGADECGAFLIWGDPTLYDSTLRIVAKLKSKGDIAFDYEVIPGISSVQALAARHRVPLNRIGEAIHITTGRKLAAEGWPDNADSVVVVLDGEQAFNKIDGKDIDIYWGAYVGTADEIVVSGRLAEVRDKIDALRAEARAENGWIMDVYLLRKSATEE